MKKYAVLDLYAGTGRCSEPYRTWRRTKDVTLVDVNPYAAEVYQANFPGASYKVANLGNLSAERLRSISGRKVDILLGCPPCQGFSDCGARQDVDPRNNHISRMKNLISAIKPKAIAMENVPLAAISDKFENLKKMLEDIGYIWRATIANAALWGSCQTRQRLILIAFRKDVQKEFNLPDASHGGMGKYFSYKTGKETLLSEDLVSMLGRTPATLRVLNDRCVPPPLGSKPIPTVSEALADLPPLGSVKAQELGHVAWEHSASTLRRMKNVSEGGRWSGGKDHFSQTYGRLHRNGLARTITGYFPNAGSGRFWHPTENRALTLREAARIQGFPDSFKFLNQPRQNCFLIGNALDAAISRMTFEVVSAGLC